MKKLFLFFIAILLGWIMLTGCHKTPSPKPLPLPPPVLKIMGQENLSMSEIDIKINITTNGNKISAAGICYSEDKNPTTTSQRSSGSNSGSSTIHLANLNNNTHYYYRVYALDDQGKTYYSDSTKSFWTYSFKDYDGNYYHTVTIGKQTFTVENLKVTHYRNGDAIPNITDDMAWHNATSGAICWYDNNKSKYDSVYGALYNFYAVVDPRGLAPAGWHIPSYDEYIDLMRFLDNQTGSNKVGGKIKEKGFKHWKAPNTDADNSTGFTALPGGDRGDKIDGSLGTFTDLTTDAVFWTSTKFSDSRSGLTMEVYYNNNWLNVGIAYLYNSGYSVRLIKNN